ncbi:hypothetical protein [Nostoc sp. 'Peltigera membranacea cyanobiont' 213]|uniref:hypothetical protein n=1 Tax=Nostoc sp. 'Peltigera membranacea cyanobiont' 213 TaxID=2014530 RepID=UPI00167EC07D|nr:hypothetical protein [Nostoc sp. 'Peltigera membranacea cyanobiont' 213]
MEVNLPALIKYFEMLCSLEDGDEIHFGERIVKRMGNRIWESVFIVNEEDEEEIEEV